MASDLIHVTAVIPAGTPAAAPVTVAAGFPPRVVTQVDWRVPNGPMGVFGWRLSMGQVQVLPSIGDAWVIANDEHGTWHLAGQPDSGAWQVIGYNTGIHPHSVYLTFHADHPEKPPEQRQAPNVWDFMPAPDLSLAGRPLGGM